MKAIASDRIARHTHQLGMPRYEGKSITIVTYR